MKILIIGGTGIISTHVRLFAEKCGDDVTVINRGNRIIDTKEKIHYIKADINDIESIKKNIKDIFFDIVIDFVCFCKKDVLKRYELFKGRIGQYVFISSATVYNVTKGIVTESSPVGNSFSRYAQDKIECERVLADNLQGKEFPITIIRPSHTYDATVIPMGVHGKMGSWQNVKRILEGKKVIIHDDGNGVWAMLRSEDFAVQLYGILGKAESFGQIYQIASEESLKWVDIYSIIADELNRKLEICFIPTKILALEGQKFELKAKILGDKARSLVFKNNAIRKVIGEYHPFYTMEQGIRNSVRNVLCNSSIQKEDEEFDIWCEKMISIYR